MIDEPDVEVSKYYLRQLHLPGTVFTALQAYLTFPRVLVVLYACLSLPPSLGLSST